MRYTLCIYVEGVRKISKAPARKSVSDRCSNPEPPKREAWTLPVRPRRSVLFLPPVRKFQVLSNSDIQTDQISKLLFFKCTHNVCHKKSACTDPCIHTHTHPHLSEWALSYIITASVMDLPQIFEPLCSPWERKVERKRHTDWTYDSLI